MTIVLPKLKVEISFTASAFTGLSWTDVTADYRVYAGAPIHYGRPDQYQQMSTGTLDLVFDNHTGNYTPDNAAGTHYPNATRGRAVRVSATEDNVTYYPRYYGYIDSIQITWDNETGLAAAATIHCVDLLALLAGAPVADNIVTSYINAGGPVDYWTFGDPAGTLLPANEIPGGQKLTLQLTDTTQNPHGLVFGDYTGLGTDGLTAAYMQSSQLGSKDTSTTAVDVHTTGITIIGFYQCQGPFSATNPPADYRVFATQANGFGYIVTGPNIDSTTGQIFNSWDETGLPLGVADSGIMPGPVIKADEWFMIANRYTPSGGGQFSVFTGQPGLDPAGDVVTDTVVAGISVVGGASVPGGMGWWDVGHVFLSLSTNGKLGMAHIAMFDSALTDQQIEDIYSAGITGFAGEDSATRMARLLSLYNSTMTLTTIGSPGTTDLAGLNDIKGKFVLDLMNDTMNTERGMFYIDRSGNPTLRTRLARYNQAVALTIPNGTLEPSFSLTQDRTNLINDEQATAAGSANIQQVTDQTSIDNNGYLGEQTSLLTRSDAEAFSFAQWRVGDGKPKTRSSALDLDMLTQQNLPGGSKIDLTAFWQLDLGEICNLTGLPSQVGNSTLRLAAEAIDENLSTTGYPVTITTSPDPGNAWVLQDAVYGLLGSTTYLAY